MTERIKAIFFDLDDTLFDRREAQKQLLNLLRRDFRQFFGKIEEDVLNKAFTDSDAASTVEFSSGVPLDLTRLNRMRRFLSILGLPEDGAPAVNDCYLSHYASVWPSVDGAVSVVRQLSGEHQLGIISNGSPGVQHAKLDGMGIKGFFSCIVLSEACGTRKPDTAIFARAVEGLGRKAGECLHIGDSYANDVLGAHNAGLRSCWFNPDGLPAPPGHPMPELEVRSLRELPALLGRSG